MATLELVEKLRTHANVSYDDAREALDACGDDILDAIIYLERKGKVETPQHGGTYSTGKQDTRKKQHKPREEDYDYEPHGETFGQLLKRFWGWFCRLVQKGNRNLFVIYTRHGEWGSLPITVLIVLLIFCFWVIIPLILIGLIFGFRFRFRGKEIEGVGANSVMDGISGVADDVTRSVQNAVRESSKQKPEDDDTKD